MLRKLTTIRLSPRYCRKLYLLYRQEVRTKLMKPGNAILSVREDSLKVPTKTSIHLKIRKRGR